MSEPDSDPLQQLFSPAKPTASARAERSDPVNESPPVQARQNFWIDPPVLDAEAKSKYKTIPEEFIASGVEFDSPNVDQIIGEYSDESGLYYFARFQDGIAHKFNAGWFMKQHPDLVQHYTDNKANGNLDPFDPSAHYVHPRSRVKITLTIAPRAKNPALKGVNRKGTKVVPEVIDLSSDAEEVPDSEDDEDEGDEDEEYGKRATRKSSRATKKSIKNVPFSPRKTRAKKGFAAADLDIVDEEDSDEMEEVVPTRKSSRSTKNSMAKYRETDDYMDVDGESEMSTDDDDDAFASSRKVKPKKKKPSRRTSSRPAYGHFRPIHDLEEDDLSDSETAALRAHRAVCEKCHRLPANDLIKAASKKKSKGGRRKKDEDMDDFEGDEMERLNNLGGWVRCLKCPVTAHWGCLASTQRQEILKAAQDRDRALLEEAQRQAVEGGLEVDEEDPTKKFMVKKRAGLSTLETTEFICGSCIKGGICMGCMDVAIKPDNPSDQKKSSPAPVNASHQDSEMIDDTQGGKDDLQEFSYAHQLVYRCFTCKRLAHYAHLPVPPDYHPDEADEIALAQYYQEETEWRCGDCSSYTYELDKVLAWRPYPANAIEPPRPDGEPPHYKSALPREYLVKWQGRSYRRTQWVPHMWLVATHAAKLKNFLDVGAKVELLEQALPDETAMDIQKETSEPQANIPFEIGADAAVDAAPSMAVALPLGAAPDAERRIPPAWKTVDRVLDVLLWTPGESKTDKKGKGKAAKRRVESDDDDEGEALDAQIESEFRLAFDEGEQPRDDVTETVAEWEARKKTSITTKDIKNVVWAFIKWDDLPYDESTWDSPPRPGKPGYAAFENAFDRFVASRRVQVPAQKSSLLMKIRPEHEYKKEYALSKANDQQPNLGQGSQLKLMPFQIDGFNWLCDNWWRLQHCILADEMGLGKTVQIVTFLGSIMDKWKAFPALVVVPNSTITNWVREFEKWAPKLRVVPFYGEMKSRDIIKKFELRHEKKQLGTTGTKFHVLVTTYESLNNTKDFAPVFGSIPRWEVLVVDEGQRLKSDSSLLFKKLNELKTIHRIIMTGTPLNNNIRELFNLMNFLDPDEWNDLEALEKEHEELTEDLVKQLHERLRPYFLRRIKSEVLTLPPKNEVIVPVSMAPLQKEVYRSILSKNLDILKVLTKPANSKTNNTIGKLNNMLMQLRKCLQHPYLINDDIEPRGLSVQETQYKLTDASAKLRLLKTLLPQLKARGHRVLLFSQFVIALNIVEDFLNGEGYKYLRLDGSTKQAQRQKDMDEFNKPDSDVFIFLLTTRAGGVGINLFTADTVIIFDPDFNPHQDLQAIARAYRYGQQKTCLVFKLMVKDSAEERIMQTGKKKLVLDHLIVQKMDEDDSAGDDVQSILTYGAKALFEEGEQASQDIIYTDQDIEKLVERTEKEGDNKDEEKKEGLGFAFAQIWSAEKDTLEEVQDENSAPNEQDDSWTQTLARIAAESAKVRTQEVSGRGVRRRAAVVPKPMVDFEDTPVKKKGASKFRSKSTISDESDAYTGSGMGGSDGEDTDDTGHLGLDDLRTLAEPPVRAIKGLAAPPSSNHRETGPLSPIHNTQRHDENDTVSYCGLCGTAHGDGACYMTESSDNLAEYRQMLILHADDEPMEERKAAIRVIDETLFKRGKLHLIDGQPLHLLENDPPPRMPAMTMAFSHITPSLTTSTNPASSSGFPMDMPSGPKRSSPSIAAEEPSAKKKKVEQSSSGCVVCGQSYHLVKDCPIVLQGPKSVSKEIKRLQDNPKHSSTVAILTKILKKQKRRELSQAEASSSAADNAMFVD